MTQQRPSPEKAEHTPTPWCWDDQDCGNSISIRFDPQHPNAVGDEIASIYRDGIENNDQMRADAAFIVKAVNNFDALVKALETAAGRFNLMTGVGLVNGADPKVGYREIMDVLARIRSPQEKA